MGRVEKIVVLSVVFAIVVILVVSTQTGGDPVEAAGGGHLVPAGESGAEGRIAAELPAPAHAPSTRADEGSLDSGQAGPEDLSASGGAPRSILSSGGRAAPASTLLTAELLPSRPVYEIPATIPADWDLETLAGLAEHLFDPSLKVYTARSGDTLESLARRYYGDEAFVPALERNNEGVRTLRDGQQILLPVRARAIVDEPGDLYVVQDGESLWKIAKKVYGQGHLWGDIWDANRDVLPSPEAIRPGITLRIP